MTRLSEWPRLQYLTATIRNWRPSFYSPESENIPCYSEAGIAKDGNRNKMLVDCELRWSRQDKIKKNIVYTPHVL